MWTNHNDNHLLNVNNKKKIMNTCTDEWQGMM